MKSFRDSVSVKLHSVAHLSNQSEKVTGLTPSHFKKVGETKRKPLDKI